MSDWLAYGSIAAYSVYGGLVTYPSQVLTDSSPRQAFTEPLTLTDVKTYLVIPERSPADPAEDNLLQTLISAARAVAEDECEFDLVLRQWDIYFDYWPPVLSVGNPLVSVDLLQYRDSDGTYHDLVEGQDYIVDTRKIPGVIMPPFNRTWPVFTAWPSSAILARITGGYAQTSSWWAGDVGRKIQAGMLLLVSEWFNNRMPYDTPIKDYPYALKVLLAGGAPPKAR